MWMGVLGGFIGFVATFLVLILLMLISAKLFDSHTFGMPKYLFDRLLPMVILVGIVFGYMMGSRGWDGIREIHWYMPAWFAAIIGFFAGLYGPVLVAALILDLVEKVRPGVQKRINEMNAAIWIVPIIITGCAGAVLGYRYFS